MFLSRNSTRLKFLSAEANNFLVLDFVNAARQVLDLRMDDRSRTLNATTLQFAMKDIEAMEREEIQKVSRSNFYTIIISWRKISLRIRNSQAEI